MKIKTKLRVNGFVTIYAEDRKRLKGKVSTGDVLLVRIKGELIPLLLFDAKGSWNILISRDVIQQKNLKEGEVLELDVLNCFSKEENRYNLGKALKLKGKNCFIDIYYVLPDFLKYRNEKFYIFPINKNEILCWYKLSKPARIKRLIPLNEITLESFGLLQGEANKTGNCFSFGNNSPDIIKVILNFLEILGIDRNKLSFTASYYNPNIENKIKRYWSKICETDSKDIKFRISKRLKDCSKASEYGFLSIQIYSSVIAEIIWNLLEFVNSNVIQNAEFSPYFLRGAFEADGTVLMKNNCTISSINISCASREEASIYKKAFTSIGIRTKTDDRNYIFVDRKNIKELESWNLLWKVIKKDIFKRIPKNKEKLIKGFIGFRATKIIIKYLKPFKKRSSWTAKELRPFVLKSWDVNWVTKKLDDLTKLKLLGKVDSKYRITREGNLLLKFIRKVS